MADSGDVGKEGESIAKEDSIGDWKSSGLHPCQEQERYFSNVIVWSCPTLSYVKPLTDMFSFLAIWSWFTSEFQLLRNPLLFQCLGRHLLKRNSDIIWCCVELDSCNPVLEKEEALWGTSGAAGEFPVAHSWPGLTFSLPEFGFVQCFTVILFNHFTSAIIRPCMEWKIQWWSQSLVI